MYKGKFDNLVQIFHYVTSIWSFLFTDNLPSKYEIYCVILLYYKLIKQTYALFRLTSKTIFQLNCIILNNEKYYIITGYILKFI